MNIKTIVALVATVLIITSCWETKEPTNINTTENKTQEQNVAPKQEEKEVAQENNTTPTVVEDNFLPDVKEMWEFDTGTDYVCDIKSENLNTMLYVSPEDTKYLAEVDDKNWVNWYELLTDNMIYAWSEWWTNGNKHESLWLKLEYIVHKFTDNFDVNSEKLDFNYNTKCKNSIIEESKFELPENVEFTD